MRLIPVKERERVSGKISNEKFVNSCLANSSISYSRRLDSRARRSVGSELICTIWTPGSLLSVELKCYRGPHSRSRWISIKVSVELKCYRGPHSRSRWISIKLSVKLKCYRGPHSRSRWISIKLSVELKCYRGPQSRSQSISNEVSSKLNCYRGPQSRARWLSNELSAGGPQSRTPGE